MDVAEKVGYWLTPVLRAPPPLTCGHDGAPEPMGGQAMVYVMGLSLLVNVLRWGRDRRACMPLQHWTQGAIVVTDLGLLVGARSRHGRTIVSGPNFWHSLQSPFVPVCNPSWTAAWWWCLWELWEALPALSKPCGRTASVVHRASVFHQAGRARWDLVGTDRRATTRLLAGDSGPCPVVSGQRRVSGPFLLSDS
jgi:hypothetical protein